MTRLKIASAALLLSAAIAAPVMAQEVVPGNRYEPQPGPTYYQSYDEYDAPAFVARRFTATMAFTMVTATARGLAVTHRHGIRPAK